MSQKDFGTPTVESKILKGGSVEYQKIDNGFQVMLSGALNSGTTKNSLEYYVDWSLMGNNPNQQYEMYWTFYTVRCDLSYSASLQTPMVKITCGGFDNYSSTSGQSCVNVPIIGTIVIQNNGSFGLIRADESSNPPVFFKSRPTNNIFKVEIVKSGDYNTLWTPNSGAFPGNYLLTMKFIEV